MQKKQAELKELTDKLHAGISVNGVTDKVRPVTEDVCVDANRSDFAKMYEESMLMLYKLTGFQQGLQAGFYSGAATSDCPHWPAESLQNPEVLPGGP